MSFNKTLRNNWRFIFIVFALVADSIAIIIAGWIAYILKGQFFGYPTKASDFYTILTLFYGFVVIITGLLIGLYRATLHSNNQRMYFLASKTYVLSVLLVLSLLYTFRLESIPQNFTFFFFWFYLLHFFLVVLH